MVSDLKSEHGIVSNSGCKDGHFAGDLALFLKEATDEFSKITIVGRFRGRRMIAEAMPINSI